MKYKQITIGERIEIYRLLQLGKSAREIGTELARHHSTISRELKRNTHPSNYLTVHGYSVLTATDLAEIRARSRRGKKCKLNQNPQLREIVLEKLQLRWSPMQISVYLSLTYPDNSQMQISHESIYTYVYILGRGSLKKSLHRYLRQKKVVRNYRKRASPHRQFEDMISIEERPKEVENRTIPGHWEGDLIIGKGQKSAIGTIVERTTRFLLIVPLKGRDAETVRKAFTRELKRLPDQVRLSMTYDQGSEMSQHKLFTKATKMKVFFAHPHSPWERGTNENTNMLIRDFYPKGTDFSKLSRYRLKKIQSLLNERPRRVLDWETPVVAFDRILQKSNP
ncbi:MAG: IS30 family transposase [Thiohalomonadales bacterium]